MPQIRVLPTVMEKVSVFPYSDFADITGIRLCNRANPCLTETNRVIDVSSQLKNEVIAFSDERPPRILVTNATILSKLKEYGILKPKDSFYDYDRVMLRLLLNPSYDLRYLILKEKHRLFAKRPVLGVQIRTAGLLANVKERISFINETALQAIPKLIEDTIASYRFSNTLKGIYLSSDSRIAEELVNRTLGARYPILSTNLFKKGHSTHNPDGSIVNRALIDVFMLAECDGLLTTKQSGFGTISSILAETKKKAMIPVTRQLIENFTRSSRH